VNGSQCRAPELYTHQIEVERQDLADIPQEEQEELALIYQAKGVEPEAARQMAARLIAADKQDGKYEAALDTLAREELVSDPKELGGSPWEAAITSFMLFAVGAAIPVLPFGGLKTSRKRCLMALSDHDVVQGIAFVGRSEPS
jgi:VIT1/CCC1 family predicted Fe2+/Mn2+ transporter